MRHLNVGNKKPSGVGHVSWEMIGSCLTPPLISFFHIGHFLYPAFPSDWTSLASYELILVKYSRAREGLKIERYIKPASRRGRASLLLAARQSCLLKGGNRETTASSFSAASLQLIPLQVLQRGVPLSARPTVQGVTGSDELPSFPLNAVSCLCRGLVISSSRALKRHFNALNKQYDHKKINQCSNL